MKMTPEQITAAEIAVAKIDKGTLNRKLTVPGTIIPDPDRIGRVPVRVIGTVTQLRKRLGDMVTKGEVVALLDSREVADAKSEYLTAAVNRDLQKTIYERSQALWDKRVTAEQLYLQARASYEQAQLRFDLARQKLSALDIDAGEVAEAAKRDLAKPGALNLRLYEIHAPLAGRVVERKVDQGMAVGGESDPSDLYTVADLSTLWVELAVSLSDLDTIKEGQRVSITSSGKTGEGQIIFVSPLLNPDTRSARVLAAIDNKARIWHPGSFVSADVIIDEEQAALLIPRTALQTIAGEKVVFVRTADGFEQRDVQIGKHDDRGMEVTAGLSHGESIAVTNTFLLKAALGRAESHVH